MQIIPVLIVTPAQAGVQGILCKYLTLVDLRRIADKAAQRANGAKLCLRVKSWRAST